jgi:hypothetical protein
MLKDQSTFKKSTGDEAATKSLGMGVVTHTIQGEASFVAWSMDVKIEGQNVDRHLDMTVHNEQCTPPNTPPTVYQDQAAQDAKSCADFQADEQSKCSGAPQKVNAKGEPAGLDCSAHPGCREAKACVLKPKKEDKTFCCDPAKTGHHLIEVHGFCQRGQRGKALGQFPDYKMNDAPCVCAEGSRFESEHGSLHAIQGVKENYAIMSAGSRNPPLQPDYAWKYFEARNAGLDAHAETFGPNACKRECLAQQIDDYHLSKMPQGEDTLLRTEPNNLENRFGQQGTGVAKIIDRAKRVIASITGPMG